MTRMKLSVRRKGDPVNPKNQKLPKSLKHQKKPNLKGKEFWLNLIKLLWEWYEITWWFVGKRKKKNLRSLKRGVVNPLMPHLQKRGVTLLIKLKRNLKGRSMFDPWSALLLLHVALNVQCMTLHFIVLSVYFQN